MKRYKNYIMYINLPYGITVKCMHYYKQKAYRKKTKYIKIAEYFLFPFFCRKKKTLTRGTL